MCARMRWGGVAVFLGFAAQSICGGDRQLIYSGWDCPTPTMFRAEVVDHWRLLARLARKGRLSGLCFDAEPYRKPWSQFLYAAQPSKSQHSFAEMRVKARERGREVMKAIAAEYPDMTIFAYRLFSDLIH